MRNNYLKYLIQEKFKMSAFFFWKNSPKNGQSFQLFNFQLIQRAAVSVSHTTS